MSVVQLIVITLMFFWIWLAALTLVVLGHRRRFDLASKRIALGLPPFPKAPDDGRDRYLDRMGLN